MVVRLRVFSGAVKGERGDWLAAWGKAARGEGRENPRVRARLDAEKKVRRGGAEKLPV